MLLVHQPGNLVRRGLGLRDTGHDGLVHNGVGSQSAIKNAGIAKEDVEYVVDCAEEACGDMNQRGGGNFATTMV